MRTHLENGLFYIFYLFNTAGLPFGLNWSNLLSPILVLHLFFTKKIKVVLLFLFFLLMYMLIQYTTEPYPKFIELKSFFLSSGYFFTSIISMLYFYFFLQKRYIQGEVEAIFKNLLKINAIFTAIALAIYFTPLQEYMWGVSKNINIDGQVRLKMFFSEPSHYGYISMTLLLYVTFKVVLLKQYRYLFLFFMTFLSAWLCQSTGTLGALFLALILSLIIYARLIIKRYLLQIFSIIILIAVVLTFFGDRLLSRLDKVVAGEDHSGQVRVVFSTLAGYYLIEKYNIYFGVGFGQAKNYVTQYTHKFHGYKSDRLPSSFASTISTVGLIGIFLKYLTLFFFMIRYSVYSNVFQLTLFFYALIYGFTGGWLLNTYELYLWALAFLKIFPEFEYKKLLNTKRKTECTYL